MADQSSPAERRTEKKYEGEHGTNLTKVEGSLPKPSSPNPCWGTQWARAGVTFQRSHGEQTAFPKDAIPKHVMPLKAPPTETVAQCMLWSLADSPQHPWRLDELGWCLVQNDRLSSPQRSRRSDSQTIPVRKKGDLFNNRNLQKKKN